MTGYVDPNVADHGPHPLAGALLAAESHRSNPPEGSAAVEWLIGDWAMRVRFFDAAGECESDSRGYWSFGWICDGRAIQDVLTVADANGSIDPGERGIGTSVRFYDRGADLWHVVWFGTAAGTVIRLSGGRDGERFTFRGTDVDGASLIWRFTSITPDSFEWSGQICHDGVNWRVEQLMSATRIELSVPTS
jgi:hypothetical protein